MLAVDNLRQALRSIMSEEKPKSVQRAKSWDDSVEEGKLTKSIYDTFIFMGNQLIEVIT